MPIGLGIDGVHRLRPAASPALKPDRQKRARCATRVLASLTLSALLLNPALSQTDGVFSRACDKLRRDAIHAYWISTVSPEQVNRMEQIAGAGDSATIGAGFVNEALAGRITMQQLGASALAGVDAVEMSAICGEHDRQAAKRIRLLLPDLLVYATKRLSERRSVH